MTRSQDQNDKFLTEVRWVAALSAVLIAIGILSRLAPLTDFHGRLLRQFMTEDGYLMQTVARNLGLGLGLAVSDGTIQTNGVQPLATFIFSMFYMVAGGDKIGGIAGVTVFSAIASLAAAGLLYVLVRKVLREVADERQLALLVAALWFSSTLIVKHSMNGLETGLYFVVLLATMNLFVNFLERDPSRFSGKQMLALGAMFGLCFLVRNDAAFLIAAMLFARIVLRWPRGVKAWRDRIVEATVPGLVSIVIASPWLIYNYWLFDTIVPISGISEAHGARFGQNLVYVPALLLEYVMVIVPIPASLETRAPTIILSIVVVMVAVVIAGGSLWRRSRIGQYILVTFSVFAVLLASFYALFFGAPYFMSRYLSILSPFFALVGVVAAYRLLMLMRNQWRRAVVMFAAAVAVPLVLVQNTSVYRSGLRHEHFQVVDWVDTHVPRQTWVGAVQSGTLGFFHDRTLNLDGKVSPDALRSRLDEGDVISYVLGSEIMFLVDWSGIAKWSRIDKGGFSRKFELIVNDERANLAVLRRIDHDAR